jgi:hypothetical protein
MKIKVEVKSTVLGDSIFWEGDVLNINEIRNNVAKDLAKMVAKDGNPRKEGMWHVSSTTVKPNKMSASEVKPNTRFNVFYVIPYHKKSPF